MNYRPLGATGLTVSEIGFGGWGIGGVAPGTKSYGPADDSVSIHTLRHAFEQGVTFYDTADLYGLGHSENLIGEALSPHRVRIVICSKVGTTVDPSGSQGKDFSPEHIRHSISGTLRRLRTDYLDLYLLHDPPIDALLADPRAVETMRELKAAGMIRAWGISLRSPADGAAAVGQLGAQAIQVNFNMIDQRIIENGLLDLCAPPAIGLVAEPLGSVDARHGVGVIGRTPLCFGFLTGRYGPDTKFAAGDHRAGWPAKQIALWASAPALFRNAIGCPPEQTPGQLALRYCLSYPALSTVIPGMLQPREVDENVAASMLGPLSDLQKRAAERVYRENVFFSR
jgi:aryl-alcohol dehydrogenase-like predicted oxidoreductase